ncbi:hypothetical protein QYZ88_006775 [Lachnospiraceae bacterium C1.1]|nr:hypothetical protein [Lachnospiraceae bacterium C1.1]
MKIRLRKELTILLSASLVFSAGAFAVSAEEGDVIVVNAPENSASTDSENTYSENELVGSLSSDTVETENYRVCLNYYPDKLTGYDSVSVSEIKDNSEEYEKIIETLSANDIKYDRIFPLDVSLINTEGNEFEPEEGAVKSLSIETLKTDITEDMLQGIDADSLKLVHLINDTVPEILADNSAEDKSNIEVEKENEGELDESIVGISTEVEPDSFSTMLLLANNSDTDISNYEVETVDSSELGFNMYMLDSTKMQFNLHGSESGDYGSGTYGKGSIEKGVYSVLTQGADGTPDYLRFPVVKSKPSISLKDYTYGTKVDNLFIKDKHDNYGNFYFNSAEYFASLKYDDDDSSFNVFSKLGTPSNSNKFYYQRGNFMPYNTLKLSDVRNHNLYSDFGVKLKESDPRYNEALYGFNESNDYYFGFYGYGRFFQPANGKISSNGAMKPMTYEFIGDDDMLVYIDGVLVLDLGGVHDGQCGTINFQTGEVKYSTSDLSDIESGKEPTYETTTIRKMFEAAEMETTENWESSQDNKTFEYADGKSHLLQMFYLERGAGASNLKLDFNLAPVPEGAVTVHKAVSLNDAQVDYSQEYTMQILDSTGTNTVSGAQYYYDTDSSVIHTTDESGEFTLKPGQTAIFIGLDVDKTWKFKEKTSSSDYELFVDEYVVTDKYGNTTTYSIAGGTYDRWEGIRPSIEIGKSDVSLIIDNNFHTADIKVNKKFVINGSASDNAPDSSEFANAKFVLQTKENDSWRDVTTVSYNAFEDGSYDLDDLMINKEYRLVEAVSENSASSVDSGNYENVDGGNNKIGYKYTTVSVGNADADNGVVSDSILLDEDDEDTVTEITFTNYYETVYVPPTGVKIPDEKGALGMIILIMLSSAAALVYIDRKRMA